MLACTLGRLNVVEFLLDKDVDLSGREGDGQSPLHCAAIGGQLKTVKFLLKQNAPLQGKNIYGGTVLGQTLWSGAHGGDLKVYAAIIKVLIAAGAKLERHVPVNKPIDDLPRGYGSIREPTWSGLVGSRVRTVECPYQLAKLSLKLSGSVRFLIRC